LISLSSRETIFMLAMLPPRKKDKGARIAPNRLQFARRRYVKSSQG